MQLSVRDTSKLLKLSEKELYLYIKKNEIPYYTLNKSFYFNRAELLEWAISRSVEISPTFFSSPDTEPEHFPLLTEALKTGGVFVLHNVLTKSEVLKKIVSLLPTLTPTESDLIFNALMARETLGSTAIGNGIAIPHVRNPIILNIKGPSIILTFVTPPIDFGAIDGQKVSIIFTMISPTARIHLHLLARLSYLLQNKDVKTALLPETNTEHILEVFRTAEDNIGKAENKSL